MTWRKVLILAALAGAVAIGAAWLAPATLVDSRLSHLSGGNLRFADGNGTIWQGRGVIAAGPARLPVAWRAEPLALLGGEARVHLVPTSAGGGESARGDITVGAGNLSIRNMNMTLPASIVVVATGRAAADTVAGEITVTSAALDWTPTKTSGQAEVAWRGARLALVGSNAPIDLGDVRMNLVAEGDGFSGPVSNTGGDLDVRGSVGVRDRDGVVLMLSLAPRDPDNKQLALGLATIGAADGDRWRVTYRFPLR